MFNDYGGYNSNSNPAPAVPSEPILGRARIKVIGVGGAGNNAVNRMLEAGITSAEYYVVNTDSQILALSPCKNKIQIGGKITLGLGAGADPEVGRQAAEESREELTNAIKDTDLLFITAGMGGGTGTGAAPVIAKIARDMKILTVAVVTEPFSFEGRKRLENTVKGLDNLKKYVDTLIVIPNDKIKTVVPPNTPMPEALLVADEILKQGIRGIAELIVNPSLINLDFADVRTILKDKGIAHLGVGVAKGENRILEAVRVAINCPLLETTIEGARGVILNVCGGSDLTIAEVEDAGDLVKSVVDASANIIFGARIDPNVQDEVEITIIATDFPGYSKQGEEQRLYKGTAQYDQSNYASGSRPSVREPLYPSRQVPVQPQPAVQPVQPQQPAYPTYPQNPVGQPYPGYVQPQPAAVQQQVQPQQPVYPGYPQNPAQTQQPVQPQQSPMHVREDGVIERQSEKKIPKFIQRLKGNNNSDD